MQRKKREIEIFSLSAIDLFCSSMGAVMVLMVLLLPYYGKSTPPAPVEPVQPIVVAPPAPAPPANAIQVQDIDIVFIMDATMSMQDELETVRTGLASIIQVLRRISDDARVGFVAYIDRAVLTAAPLLPVNRGPQGEANLRRLQAVVDGVELVGNADWPEHVHGGIAAAASFPWGPAGSDRRQIIVIIGDAPTHPEHVQASYDLVRRWVAGSSRRSVSVVNTVSPDDIARYPEAGQAAVYFKELTRLGNGSYFERTGDLMGSILDLIIVR